MFQPGPLSAAAAAELNRLRRDVDAARRLHVAPPLSMTRGADGAMAITVVTDSTPVRYARITADLGKGQYEGVGGELFLTSGGDPDDPDDYEFQDLDPAVTYDADHEGLIYRVPSSRYDEPPEPAVLPTIKPTRQYVMLIPSQAAPGRWLATPWGSQLRVIMEVVYRTCSVCVDDVLHTKNAIRVFGWYARDLRVLLKPSGTAEDGIEADITGS
jgi:hypothetical protein